MIWFYKRRFHKSSFCKWLVISCNATYLSLVIRQPVLFNFIFHEFWLSKDLDHFKYLGSVLTRDGYCTSEIKMWIVIAKEAFNRKIAIFLNIMIHAPMGRYQLELIYYFTYFSTVIPSKSCVFLSCRHFVVVTTSSTGLVGIEVSCVSWLGQLTVGV